MYVYWGHMLKTILLMGWAVESLDFLALGSCKGNEFQMEVWFLKW